MWNDAWSKFTRRRLTEWPTPRAPRPGGHRNGFWGLLSLPGVVWLLALFVVPFYAIAAVAFGRIDPILRTADPVWSPSPGTSRR